MLKRLEIENYGCVRHAEVKPTPLHAFVGASDTGKSTVLKAIEALGYDEFSLWIDSGMSFERKRDSLKRFIEDVMPAFA